MDAIIELTQETEKLKHIAETIKEYNLELNNNETKLETLNSALKLVQLTKSYKINSRKDFILDIINQGLKIIFDEDYKIDLESEESKTANKYTITYKLRLYKNNKLVATNQELFETSGGGLITIISFVLKIILGYINTKNKFYIFDESFSQISEEFRPGVAKLLKLLSTKYGFTFLIISHENLQDEDIDLAYYFTAKKSDDKIPTTIITRTKLKDKHFLDDDYYEVEISNFQSLKYSKVKIKGVTVIYGRSDSGKSAFQRAIRSLITNSFNADLYKRWKTNRTNLTTKIRLSKTKDKVTEWVELEHKSKLIYRSHHGDEFVGKKLANDHIMNILESFGFAQITNDKLSKLTGDLKAQTERIFVTTQFDKFYLTNDRTGVDKILTILFDSHLLNDVISTIKNDINSINAENKILFEQIHNSNIALKETKLQVFRIISDKIISEYLLKTNQLNDVINLINTVTDQVKSIDKLISLIESSKIIDSINSKVINNNKVKQSIDIKRSQGFIINKIIEHINTIEQLVKLQTLNNQLELNNRSSAILSKKFDVITKQELLSYIESYEHKCVEVGSIETQISSINEKFKLVDDLVIKNESLIDIQQLKASNESFSIIDSKINTINQSIDITTKITQLLEVNKLIDAFELQLDCNKTIEVNIVEQQSKINDLPNVIGIHICEHCNGLGYTEK